MSRYIDADALIAEIKMDIEDDGLQEKMVFYRINEAPSIDIVFCRECKHNYNTAINHGKTQPRCDFTDYKLTENDYCSRGEREGE